MIPKKPNSLVVLKKRRSVWNGRGRLRNYQKFHLSLKVMIRANFVRANNVIVLTQIPVPVHGNATYVYYRLYTYIHYIVNIL